MHGTMPICVLWVQLAHPGCLHSACGVTSSAPAHSRRRTLRTASKHTRLPGRASCSARTAAPAHAAAASRVSSSELWPSALSSVSRRSRLRRSTAARPSLAAAAPCATRQPQNKIKQYRASCNFPSSYIFTPPRLAAAVQTPRRSCCAYATHVFCPCLPDDGARACRQHCHELTWRAQ